MADGEISSKEFRCVEYGCGMILQTREKAEEHENKMRHKVQHIKNQIKDEIGK